MAEIVGGIAYDVSLDTRQLLVDGRKVGRELDRVGSEGDKLQARFTKIASAISAAIGAIAIEGLVSKVITAQRQFDVMFASLKTMTGGVDQASAAWERLVKFAATTPYTLEQSVNGFVKLKALGLDPGERAMTSYGNTAAAMGKDLMQMIEAVADASTGEFERLKEFGIKAKVEGDKVALTFQGVTTKIGNNSRSITEYLIKIGEVQFGGAMSERMKTLDGDISNLQDSLAALYLSISQSGFGEAIAAGVRKASEAIAEVTASIKSGGLTDYFERLVPYIHAAEVAAITLSAVIAGRLVAAFVAAAAQAYATAAAIGAATIATNGFAAVVALLGGPIGIAVTGLALLAFNWDKIAGSARDAASISEDAAKRIESALKKGPSRATEDLTSQITEYQKQLGKAKQAVVNLKVGTYGKGDAKDIEDAQARVDALEDSIKKVRQAMYGVGAGPGRGSVNPPLISPALPDAPVDADAQRKLAAKRAAAQAYYEGLLADAQSGLAKIDAEEQKALTENQRHMAEDVTNAAIYAKAKTAIVAKYARERAVLEEKTAGDVAAMNIAMITDEAAKIEAVRAESFRSADAAEKLGVKTHADAERAKSLATFIAAQQQEALGERNAKARADAQLAITRSQEQKIALERDEAVRQAESSYKRGHMTFEEAEAAKTIAVQKSIEQQKALTTSRESTQIVTLRTRADGGDTQSQVDLIRAEAEAALKATEEARLKDLEASQIYADQKVAIVTRMNQQIADIEASAMTVQLAMAGNVAGQLYSLLQKAGKERTGLAKAAFLAEKAIAVATIIINTEVAAAKAQGQLGIFGIPLATMIRATGYASAGLVAGMAIGEVAGGRQYGGPVSSGSLYRVNETGKPEMFTGSNGSQYMLPTKSGNVTPADQVGGASGGWTINIHEAPAGTTATVNNEARVIDIAVGRAKAEIASEFASNTGQTWGALRGSSNVRGAGL